MSGWRCIAPTVPALHCTLLYFPLLPLTRNQWSGVEQREPSTVLWAVYYRHVCLLFSLLALAWQPDYYLVDSNFITVPLLFCHLCSHQMTSMRYDSRNEFCGLWEGSSGSECSSSTQGPQLPLGHHRPHWSERLQTKVEVVGQVEGWVNGELELIGVLN